MQIIHSHSESDTIKAAQNFAETINMHEIILLTGDLGAGKSVFARSLIRTLTGNAGIDVPSPTFTLVQNYDAQNGAVINHYDLYRLKDAQEIYELGWEDSLTEGISIVEWPERLGALTPPNARNITIEIGKGSKRVITYDC